MAGLAAEAGPAGLAGLAGLAGPAGLAGRSGPVILGRVLGEMEPGEPWPLIKMVV